jgi:hypothetical protein
MLTQTRLLLSLVALQSKLTLMVMNLTETTIALQSALNSLPLTLLTPMALLLH